MIFILLIYLIPLFFISVPIIIGVSLYRYFAARRQNKLVGGEYWKQELINRKRRLIVTSVSLVASAGVLLGLMAIVVNSIAFM